MKTVVLFDNLGPYHLARLKSASSVFELLAIEVAGKSRDYTWSNPEGQPQLRKETLFVEGTSRSLSLNELKSRLNSILGEFRPEVIFLPGWSGIIAFDAMIWTLENAVPAVSMSESTEQDMPRKGYKEWIKKRLVGVCSSALVGGSRQADYIAKLGMPPDRISLGYDAVDNDYFCRRAAEVRAREAESRIKHNLPAKYFLASARFIEKKNLPRLIQAYAKYRDLAANDSPWELVLLGDGQLRPILEPQLLTANLQNHVRLPGFKQYSELPFYYGCAGAFVHASTTEQWGLVVNEAMASGLPVLVSNRCGCAPDLVCESENGFTFDPYDVEQMAHLMAHVANLDREEHMRMGIASQSTISRWGLERFAEGAKRAAQTAIAVGPKPGGVVDRLLLHALSHR